MKNFQFKVSIGLMLLLFIQVNLALAQSTYFPSAKNWESRVAGSLGFNEQKLKQAVDFAKTNEYKGSIDLRVAILQSFANEPYHKIVGPTKERGGPAGLIIRSGYIVAQWGDVERVDMTFSVTKSFLSAVAGLAVDAQIISNVDDKVNTYVWDDTFKGSHNAKITWRHLLDQSSDWSGELFDMYDWADRPPRNGDVNTWSRRTLNEPGTVYKYNDVRVNVLAYSLLQVFREPLPVVLKTSIMDKLDASTTWRWYGYDNSWVTMDGFNVQSVSGGGHSGGGLFINTLDMARFGYLFLRKGKWNDEVIISQHWIDAMRQPSKANESYGFLWWLNRGNSKWPGVADNVYYAAGFGGNYIVVDEANDLVVITRWLDPSKIGEFMKLVTESINK
ncbi:MAG TPA: serine hydrolase [Cyclobacteriaceae bacterium]|nr:serine hydrolase [Cyclobacteriaceae bacterium]